MLPTLGLASFVFVAVFTAHAYSNNSGPGQTPRGAIVEAWANIAIGFLVNFLANFMILPMVGASFTAAENFLMGWIYTAISIIRQYALRRWFEARIHRLCQQLN